jgi:hypothetical protein
MTNGMHVLVNGREGLITQRWEVMSFSGVWAK